MGMLTLPLHRTSSPHVGLRFDGLAVNDKLVFSAHGEKFARFGFWGEQKVSGSGEIILSSGQSSFDSMRIIGWF